MQVMDATNANPGYGVAPAADNSLGERARVGRDYLTALVQNYGGDVRKALAAYNAGPGNLDKALTAAQSKGDPNWMSYLPKPQETVPYVDKIVGQLRGSGGVGDQVAGAVLPSAQAASGSDLSAKIKAARDAGYSDAEIAQHLGQSQDFSAKLQQAKSAGYSDADVYSHLGLQPPVTESREPDGALELHMAHVASPGKPELPLNTSPSELKGGVGGGLFMGAIRDPLDGGAQLLTRGVRSVTGLIPDALGGESARNFMDQQVADVDRQVRTANQEYDQSKVLDGRDGMDVARFAGNVLSPANLPAARLLKGASTAAQLAGRGALAGGATAAIQPVINNQDDFASSKAAQVLGGAAAGAVLTPVVAKVVGYLGDKVASIAQRLKGRNASQADIDAQILAALRQADPQADIKDLSSIPEEALNGVRDQVKSAMQSGEVPDAAAIARRADFDSLGIEPTTGQVTRDPMQFAREKNLRGVDLGGGQNALADRFARQNQQMTGEFDRMGAPGALDQYQAGNLLIKSLQDSYAPYKEAVNHLYAAARDSAGRHAEMDVPAFSSKANDALDSQMLGRFLPESVRGLMNDISSGKTPFNVNTAVQIDSVMSQAQRAANRQGDAAGAKAIGAVRDALNSAPVASSAGADAKGAFDAARVAARVGFSKQEASPALKAALEGEDPDKFVQKYVIGATTNEMGALRTALANDDTAVQQARAQVAEYLRKAAFRANPTGDKGMAVASYQNALAKLGRDKLGVLFSPDEIQRMERLGRVAGAITTQPAGAAVNNSNSASAVANLFTQMLGSFGRLPGVRIIPGQVRAYQNELAAAAALKGQAPAQAAKMSPATRNRLLESLAPLPIAGGIAGGAPFQ
jgi:uncharacterized protein YdbL (DUF1318 family)